MPQEIITLECTEAAAEGKPVSRYIQSKIIQRYLVTRTNSRRGIAQNINTSVVVSDDTIT